MSKLRNWFVLVLLVVALVCERYLGLHGVGLAAAAVVATGKNGKANKGIPHGSMKVPAKLQTAFTTQAQFESKLAISRKEMKRPDRFDAAPPAAVIATGTTYKDICLKYAAEIARGRELQKQFFPKRGGSNV